MAKQDYDIVTAGVSDFSASSDSSLVTANTGANDYETVTANGSMDNTPQTSLYDQTLGAIPRIGKSALATMKEKNAGIQQAIAEFELSNSVFNMGGPPKPSGRWVNGSWVTDNEQTTVDNNMIQTLKTQNSLRGIEGRIKHEQEVLGVNAPKSFAEGVIGGIVSFIPALLLSAPTDGMSIVADMGLGTFGQKYAELRSKGIDPSEAFKS